MITSEQIDSYRANGLVVLRGVLDERWVEPRRQAYDRLQREVNEQPRIANMSATK